MKTFTIKLPEAKETVGRWLEENNITIEISSALGKYTVTACRQLDVTYRENGAVSREQRSVLRVTVYGEELNEAISKACAEVLK